MTKPKEQDAHSAEAAGDLSTALATLETAPDLGFRRFELGLVWRGDRGLLKGGAALPFAVTALAVAGGTAMGMPPWPGVRSALGLVAPYAWAAFSVLVLLRVRARLGGTPRAAASKLVGRGILLRIAFSILDTAWITAMVRMFPATSMGMVAGIWGLRLATTWVWFHCLLEITMNERPVLESALHGTLRAAGSAARVVAAIPTLPVHLARRIGGGTTALPPAVGLAGVLLAMQMVAGGLGAARTSAVLAFTGGSFTSQGLGVAALEAFLHQLTWFGVLVLGLPRVGLHGLRILGAGRPAELEEAAGSPEAG